MRLRERRSSSSSGLAMKIELAPLPYSYTALEPKISKRTLEFHHDKHHAKYVNVANQMIEGTEMEPDDCATIVLKSHKARTLSYCCFATPSTKPCHTST